MRQKLLSLIGRIGREARSEATTGKVCWLSDKETKERVRFPFTAKCESSRLCVCFHSGAGGAVGVGSPPHPTHQSGPAGAGGAPGDPERRLRRQGDGETQLHH